MFKKGLFYILILLFSSCNGIFYPKIFFDITPVKNKTPDWSRSYRYKYVNKYKQEIVFGFSQPGNDFKKRFITTIFVNKPYKYLKINKISYRSEYGSGIITENLEYSLPSVILNTKQEPLYDTPFYYEHNGYYWTIFLTPIDKNITMPKIDFQKVFKNKKPGEEFIIQITVNYTFDNEEARSVDLFYEVYANKGSFTTPLMGIG